MTEAKKYRYTRSDFEPLVTKPIHFDMVFDIGAEKVDVTLLATYKYHGESAKTELKLNSKGLEVHSVERFETFSPVGESKDFVGHVSTFAEPAPQEFKVDTEDHYLIIQLAKPVQKGEEFVIRTKSTATPTKNVLEGLYFDYTPEGCPPTIITQCQQYGFQRIVPCIDTMDAKTHYTTTIIADKNYTNMITNGDLAPGFHDESGAPIYQDTDEFLESPDPSRHVLKYYNHKVCMAPYLFFLGVGTYNTYRRTLEFPDGDTTLLEILTLPGRATSDEAKVALQMLHDSIMWVMVSLGPEACEHCEERKEIYELLKEREEIKSKISPLAFGADEVVPQNEISSEESARLQEVRDRLNKLISLWGKTGYKYTGAVYREIAMENSYYGGMENVGNTTIISSCLCPSCSMADANYEYMERVKVHEYYHNINGSQVTGQSPFEIWLNEAVTVHMERKRYADLFGNDYTRLNEVKYMFRPALGPLAQDKSSTALSVEPEGFNQTQELVSVATYSKAPEFVRMVELILGDADFHKAIDMYHTKYSFANATTMDWIECMEKSSGHNLQALANTWLRRPGHPTVSYSSSYDASSKCFEVKMSQEGFKDKPEGNNGPWDIPIDYALIRDGKVMKEGLYRFTEEESVLKIEGIEQEPDFISFARGWSFFGISKNISATPAQLKKQALTDPDAINRYFAYTTLADNEKAKIVEFLLAKEGGEYEVSKDYVDLHLEILLDESVSPAARALTLQVSNELSSREDLSHNYNQINDARKALYQSVYHAKADEIIALYHKYKDLIVPGSHKDQLNERHLVNHLLSLIVHGTQAPVVHIKNAEANQSKFDAFKECKDLFETNPFMTNQLAALKHILQLETSEKEAFQAKVFEEWSKDATKLEKYILIVSALDSKDVVKQVRNLMNADCFDFNLAGHARTVARGLSQIRHHTVQKEDGLELMKEAFVRIGKVNQMSAYPILSSFDQAEKFDDATKAKLIKTLEDMQSSIDAKKEESLYNQLNRILKKA